MNIDKIEKMENFPNFLKYIKMNLTSSFEWILLIFLFMAFFFSVITAGIFIVMFSIIEYFMDKKIFEAFSKRKIKNDTN